MTTNDNAITTRRAARRLFPNGSRNVTTASSIATIRRTRRTSYTGGDTFNNNITKQNERRMIVRIIITRVYSPRFLDNDIRIRIRALRSSVRRCTCPACVVRYIITYARNIEIDARSAQRDACCVRLYTVTSIRYGCRNAAAAVFVHYTTFRLFDDDPFSDENET